LSRKPFSYTKLIHAVLRTEKARPDILGLRGAEFSPREPIDKIYFESFHFRNQIWLREQQRRYGLSAIFGQVS